MARGPTARTADLARPGIDTLIAVLIALLLDRLLGEPRRWHPLVGFGRLADGIERQLNAGPARRIKGLVAWSAIILPIVVVAWGISVALAERPAAGVLWQALVLYFCIGWRSLVDHARAVLVPLQANDLPQAREAVSFIVSRETGSLDQAGVARGAIESVLENGADAVFAALFWFALLGAPGVLLYRLANTLDAMWGYRNERYASFGWWAARSDDLLNIVPAQLTALTYALLGNTRQAFRCWRHQGLSWKSPAAGSVMAAGAGALHVSLGGTETYHGKAQTRGLLGPEPDDRSRPDAGHLRAAITLVNRTLLIWCGVFVAFALLTL